MMIWIVSGHTFLVLMALYLIGEAWSNWRESRRKKRWREQRFVAKQRTEPRLWRN